MNSGQFFFCHGQTSGHGRQAPAQGVPVLDVLSRGRLEVAFPLGTGMEYWANPINPATARERHREAIDIILQAWTQDGPTTYYGDFYTYRYLNPWPRPYQQPHPPCYIVGTGSQETIDLADKHGLEVLHVAHREDPHARAAIRHVVRSVVDLKGQIVKTLKPGTYSFAVADKSNIHSFTIKGPGVNNVGTSVPFIGNKTVMVTLKKGTYTFYCTLHLFKTTVKVG